jgi:hypothetical protein
MKTAGPGFPTRHTLHFRGDKNAKNIKIEKPDEKDKINCNAFK